MDLLLEHFLSRGFIKIKANTLLLKKEDIQLIFLIYFLN